jgi:SAM-dependent methyltransferase
VESLYRVMHRFGITPWEQELIPSALTSIVDGYPLPAVALDLGCGTGGHAAYLAGSGWEVVGVDVSPRAIARARARSTHVDWRVTDITRDTRALDDLAGRVDLLLDVGCLHGLSDAGRQRWGKVAGTVAGPDAQALVRAVAPGHARGSVGPRGIRSAEIRALLGPSWSQLATVPDPSWHRFRRLGP